MKSEPCNICGGTDVNLVDGYYYCVECGTQDTTIRETVVERVILKDGTCAHGQGRRKVSKKKVVLQMSGEWYKWHAFNFMLSGIADEVVALGAKPSFKSKLMWIWVLYIKKFHDKEEYDKNNLTKHNTILETSTIDSDVEENEKPNKSNDKDKIFSVVAKTSEISCFSYRIMFAMIYCALNLDKSDIQASDIVRFIREGRLSCVSATKYIPKELNVTGAPQFENFCKSFQRPFTSTSLLEISCSLFDKLDLGSPFVPNLGSLVTRYCKELCLPKEFRLLIMSLLELMPPEVYCGRYWRTTIQIPEFETIVMAYIIVGLKMCFGLDDDYDLKLTYVANEINDEENHLKAYRIGLYEHTDRLFSFGEWLKYLEYRKQILCKYYHPMALKHNIGIDSYTVVESLKGLPKRQKRRARDEIAAELINKIANDNDYDILAKEDFPASLTPLTACTEYILLNAPVNDSRIKLLLSEDFSKYNLKYACIDMNLTFSAENIIEGVTELNKNCYNIAKKRTKFIEKSNLPKLTFVKDAQNDNVLGNYAIIESETGDDVKVNIIKEEKDVCQADVLCQDSLMEELDEDKNIFGVNFNEIDSEANEYRLEDNLHIDDFISDNFNDSAPEFDAQQFNNEDIIKSLLLASCAKHKIAIPYEFKSPATERPNRRTTKENGETTTRKKGEVYTGEFNVKNILKLYEESRQREAEGRLDEENYNPESDNDSLDSYTPENDCTENLNIEVIASPASPEISSQTRKPSSPNPADITANNTEMDIDEENTKSSVDDSDFEKIDVKDIIKNEVKKYEEEASKIGHRVLRAKSVHFTPADDVPLAELILKKRIKARDRSKMEPFLNDPDSLKKFNYFFTNYDKSLLEIGKRTHSFESEMADNFPLSFRYLLRTCSSMIEASSYQLFRFVQKLESNMKDV